MHTKTLNGHGYFQIKNLQDDRYIELCSPFSRISNSFPRIDNSFPRIRQSALSDCKQFPRFRQLFFLVLHYFTRIV